MARRRSPGLDRFEGRSSLKTWILRIVANRARTRGERERAQRPALLASESEDEPAVDPDRFFAADHPLLPGRLVGPAAGRAGPRSGCWPPRRSSRCATRSPSCRRASRRSSSCATSRAGSPRRSAQALDAQRRATSGCCCTAPARRSAPSSSATSTGRAHEPDRPGGISCQRSRRARHRLPRRRARPDRTSSVWTHIWSCATRAPSTSSRSAPPAPRRRDARLELHPDRDALLARSGTSRAATDT